MPNVLILGVIIGVIIGSVITYLLMLPRQQIDIDDEDRWLYDANWWKK